MLKKILLVIVVLIVAVLLYATTKPDTFIVKRSVSIKASPEKIVALINDFNRWPSWSPWEKLDPTMKKTLSGPASGPGSIYEWEGNSKVGQGRMEILESTPTQIKIKLDFIKPFEGHNITVFTLQPQGDVTNVTWDMSGPSNYMSKLMQVFMNMDTMIGNDFEKGLAAMKAQAEG
ncbi:MAG: SRPBCC family protein [Solimonas sp.]